jgi:nucleotide-binding universal stress UspA family protein
MPPEIRRIGKPAEAAPQAAFRRIAACLDGSPFAERVVAHALAVARALGAPVTLLRVIEGGSAGEPPADPLAWDLRRKEASEYLARLAEGCGDERAPLDAEVIEGNVAEQICLWAKHHDADLTVLASHGLGGPAEWQLASNARKLAEHVPGSLLLVPAGAAPPPGSGARYGRVLVPLDGSLRAESVLPLATRLVAASEGELVLVHAVPVPELTEVGPLDAEDMELRDRLVRRNERVANEYLDRLRAQLAESVPSVRAIVLRGGDARGRLTRLIADLGVDLVVVAAHGRTGRTQLPCGSVTAHLMAYSAAPILIVRPRVARPLRRVQTEGTDSLRLPGLATP